MGSERFQLPGCLNSPLVLHGTRLFKGSSSSPVRLGPELWRIALERNRLWLTRLSCGNVSQVCDFFICRAWGPYFPTYWKLIFFYHLDLIKSRWWKSRWNKRMYGKFFRGDGCTPIFFFPQVILRVRHISGSQSAEDTLEHMGCRNTQEHGRLWKQDRLTLARASPRKVVGEDAWQGGNTGEAHMRSFTVKTVMCKCRSCYLFAC